MAACIKPWQQKLGSEFTALSNNSITISLQSNFLFLASIFQSYQHGKNISDILFFKTIKKTTFCKKEKRSHVLSECNDWELLSTFIIFPESLISGNRISLKSLINSCRAVSTFWPCTHDVHHDTHPSISWVKSLSSSYHPHHNIIIVIDSSSS